LEPAPPGLDPALPPYADAGFSLRCGATTATPPPRRAALPPASGSCGVSVVRGWRRGGRVGARLPGSGTSPKSTTYKNKADSTPYIRLLS